MDEIPVGRIKHILSKYDRSRCACGSDNIGDLARKGEEPTCWQCKVIGGSGRDRNRERYAK